MSIPNYREQIKAVFFDIDETLFVKNKAHLPESVIPAIQKLHANGILVGIATGRARCSFPEKLNRVIEQENIDLFVTMNGQSATYRGEVIEKHPIPTEKIVKLVNFFDQHGVDYAFVTNEQIRVSAITPKLRHAFDPITTNYSVDKHYYNQRDIFQVLPFYDESFDQAVADAHILDGLKTVRWHEDSVDIFDAEGSKARGIAAVAKHLGFTMENVMAFGDGLNDMEMLSAVGVGVAMGNAHEKLKQVATHITDHIEQDGVYNFLLKAGLID
ncbi:Cof-type HAD-IIB family hydrolase [Caviibacterium pharyngocola]|uniref:Cof-type HAD-IIB family hydrolase n=1 Tax=Caviibacterium pharyngocola TaxID=28159 RepID=A0A2M8RWJ6_9PAST|nr:Cof-type HAD-IIB family hydrolase [Caviibacterium pharyngocola]PJG83262.1 Cof-type HAD-IIB family hydrolase [Caviibacterium pharyngocola]